MAERMTHQERVNATLAGEPVDRPPVSMWRHFYDREQNVAGLVEAMLDFQRQFDWDFMKVNPRASYHVEDWGAQMRYGSDPGRGPVVTDWPIKTAGDWLKLDPLDINQGVLGHHLEALRLIAQGLNGEVPFLMTVFTPLSVAARLAESEETFLTHMREHPDKVLYALEVVTETFGRFAQACLDLGASGLFYATTSWATYDRLTDEEYGRFGRPYDLKLLQRLSPAPFHILHVCRQHTMFRRLADYPVAAVNWDCRVAQNPSLREGWEVLNAPAERGTRPPRAVIGGVSHRTLLAQGTAAQVAEEVEGLRGELRGASWMLGPGCTFAPEVPQGNLASIRRAIEGH